MQGNVAAFEKHRTEKSVPYWCDRCTSTKTAKSRWVGVVDGKRTTVCPSCHDAAATA